MQVETAAQKATQDSPLAKRSGGIQYYNLAENGWVTEVKDQGSCAGDVAFALVATIESSMHRQRNIKVSPSNQLDFSEKTLIGCDMPWAYYGDCDSGLDPYQAYAAVEQIGLQLETDNPWSEEECVHFNYKYDEARIQFRLLSTYDQIKAWMRNSGPVIGIIQYPENFEELANNPSTNYTYDSPPVSILGHMMVSCTGFDWNYRSVYYTDRIGAWICKASYGAGWGNKGYFRIGVGQLGIMGGALGDSIGVVIQDTMKQCIRGKSVQDIYDPSTEIDLCDAVRIGHINWYDNLAKDYYKLALGTPGFGIEPYINCSSSTSVNADFYSPFMAHISRGLLTFISGRGILNPFFFAGCTAKAVSTFRLISSNVCADEYPRPSDFPFSNWPVGFGQVDAAYCASDFSVFTLNLDGVLQFQSQVIGLTTVKGVSYASVVPSTGHRFEIRGGRIGIVGQDKRCLVRSQNLLKVDTCTAAQNYIISTVGVNV